MSKELELAAVGSAGGLVKSRRAKTAAPAHTHSHCLNCGAQLHGRYCQDCGQSADDHHRSIFHLMWEAVEGLTHLDGRLARTLPPLFFRPGRLARDHIEGRRTRHVPPFRLFLISLFIFMLVLEGRTHHGARVITVSDGPATSPSAGPPGARTIKFAGGAIHIGGTPASKSPDAAFSKIEKSKIGGSPFARWFTEHGRKAIANRQLFRSIVFEWAHRLAILLLPIVALLLTGLYFYKRQFYVYDHLVVAMQFLAFVFLLWAVVYVTPEPLRAVSFVLATLWTPVNLFMLLRGAYGSSVIGAGVKALALWVSTLVLFLALLLAILAVAMNQL